MYSARVAVRSADSILHGGNGGGQHYFRGSRPCASSDEFRGIGKSEEYNQMVFQNYAKQFVRGGT